MFVICGLRKSRKQWQLGATSALKTATHSSTTYLLGLMTLDDGGGILEKPAESKTGSNSRTRPAIEPSAILPPFFVAILVAFAGKVASVGKNVAPVENF